MMSTQKSKFCLGIVLYNPSAQELIQINLYEKMGLFEQILVHDNSSISHQDQVPTSVRYVFTGKNKALAVPYNQMIDYAMQHQFNFLCLLDQDSVYPSREIQSMIQFLSTHQARLTNTAIIGPLIPNAQNKWSAKRENLKPVRWLINSGSFLNISCLNRHHLRYDENIFLDGIDYDICWTAREKGCLIQQFSNSVLQHQVGNKLSKTEMFTGHAADRYYYIAHNTKYIRRKHMGYIVGSLYALASNLRLIVRIIRFETDKCPKVKEVLRGILN